MSEKKPGFAILKARVRREREKEMGGAESNNHIALHKKYVAIV